MSILTLRKHPLVILVALLTALLVLPGSSAPTPAGALELSSGSSIENYRAAPTGSAEFVPGEILVKFKSDILGIQAQTTIESLGAIQTAEAPQISLRRLRVPVGKEQELIAALKNNPQVEYAEPNYITHLAGDPNDTYYSTYQWNMPQVKVNSAWHVTTGSNAVRVAILDTGIDWFHPDLQANIVSGNNCGDTTTNPVDYDGHGTHIAGIVAGIGNNGVGIAGMTWNVKIVPVKVDCGTTFDLAAGITWAADQKKGNAKILNISMLQPSASFGLLNAVTYAQSEGALIIAAAGNCGGSNYAQNHCDYQNQTLYPAGFALPNVMAVAATGYGDVHPPYSNHGSYISVSAPGGTGNDNYRNPRDWILSTYARTVTCDIGAGRKCPANGYAEMIGTSMAAPHVAGLAALIWSANPGLTADQVRSIIENSADDIGTPGRDVYFGWGRINRVVAQ